MLDEINLVSTASLFEVATPTAIIPCRSWGVLPDARAIIILVHGLGSHSGWFESLGNRLTTQGLYAVSYDQMGFGQRKQHTPENYTQWLDDLTAVFNYVKAQAKETPIFLLGNSMGALTCLARVNYLNPAGLILTSPGFAGHPQAFTPAFVLKSLLLAVILPKTKIQLPYPPELLSKNQNIKEWLLQDTDFCPYLPAAILLQLLRLNILAKSILTINSPVFMLIATEDFIVDNRVSLKIFDKLNAPAKKLQCVTDAYHDLLLVPEVEKSTSYIVQWISEQLLEKLC